MFSAEVPTPRFFVDTVTGLPVKPELHNERWHCIRAWVEENHRLPEPAPPRRTKWFHKELGESMAIITSNIGVITRLPSTVVNGLAPAPRDSGRISGNHHRPTTGA